MFSRNMQHYRTAKSLLPAIPVPGMQRGRLLYCQPLILTLVPLNRVRTLFALCRLLVST